MSRNAHIIIIIIICRLNFGKHHSVLLILSVNHLLSMALGLAFVFGLFLGKDLCYSFGLLEEQGWEDIVMTF